MDDGEQVQPWLVPGLRRIQRWRHGHITHHAMREVTLGRMPDGRWLVEHSDVKVGSYAYRSEQRARQRIAALTVGEGWLEAPAEYDAAGTPTSGGWRRAGGGWVRDSPSQDTADDGQAG